MQGVARTPGRYRQCAAARSQQLGRPVRQQDSGEVPVTRAAGEGRMTRQVGKVVLIIAVLLLIGGALDVAVAQFGVPKGTPKGPPSAPPPPPDGLFAWIIAKQNEFYRQFSGLIRAAKADGSAVWGLLGVSFLYGIFHAAGPGHGKAVISSYVVANDETWRRGVTLSFASALLQALVAVLLVGIAAALLGATAGTMNRAVWWIEIVSYALIAAMGARLLWVKGRGFLNEWAAVRAPKSVGAAATTAHAHHHHDHGHDHAHEHDQ